jgi:methyl-accepting chemotaxis protein
MKQLIKAISMIRKRLQDAAKHPVVGDKYVFVSSTQATVTDPILNAKLLDSGRTGMARSRIDKYAVTTFPIKDFGGSRSGSWLMCSMHRTCWPH